MAKVHFVWWGNYRPEALERAVEVARECRNAEVFMWVERDQRDRFVTGLPPGSAVTVHSMTNLRKVVGLLRRVVRRETINTVRDVRAELDRYRAFAAVKDLMVPLILWAHGGYYLDTTVRFLPGGAARFDAVVAAEPQRARLPTRDAESGAVQWHVPGYMVPERIASGFGPSALPPFEDELRAGALLAPIPREQMRPLRSIDVWAMAAPEGSRVMREMVDQYVARARAMGLTRGTGDSAPGRRILSRARTGAAIEAMPAAGRTLENQLRTARNTLIGNLAIQSAHDAFLRAPGDENSSAIGFRVAPETVQGVAVGRGVIDEWGIQKVFGGSWRNEAAIAS